MGGGEAGRGMTPLTSHVLKSLSRRLSRPWGSVLVTSKICKARTALPMKQEGSPSGARKVCERAAQHPKAAGPGDNSEVRLLSSDSKVSTNLSAREGAWTGMNLPGD